MKKLLFLLAGAMLALSSYAQTPVAEAGTRAVGQPKITKAGFAPEYYEGYLCGIFVTIEVVQGTGEILRLVDPQPHVYQIRSDNDWVDITDRVLISHEVRFTSGTLSVDFTYQYPGGQVQHYSTSTDSYPVSIDR